jgi:hypothetical protein
LPSQEAFWDGIDRRARALASSVPLWNFLEARNGLTRGGAAR